MFDETVVQADGPIKSRIIKIATLKKQKEELEKKRKEQKRIAALNSIFKGQITKAIKLIQEQIYDAVHRGEIFIEIPICNANALDTTLHNKIESFCNKNDLSLTIAIEERRHTAYHSSDFIISPEVVYETPTNGFAIITKASIGWGHFIK